MIDEMNRSEVVGTVLNDFVETRFPSLSSGFSTRLGENYTGTKLFKEKNAPTGETLIVTIVDGKVSDSYTGDGAGDVVRTYGVCSSTGYIESWTDGIFRFAAQLY